MSKKSKRKKKRVAEQKRNVTNKKLNENLKKTEEKINGKSKLLKSKKERLKEKKKIKAKYDASKENKKVNKEKKNIRSKKDNEKQTRKNDKVKKTIEIKQDKLKYYEGKNIADKVEEENLKKIEEVKNELQNPSKNLNKKKANRKSRKEKKQSRIKKIIKIIILILIIIFLIIFIYLFTRPKFKDVTIELGTEKVNVEDFLVSQMYKRWSNSVTDLNSINFSEVGENKITLKFLNKEQTVNLKIVDTTAPKVKFKDHTAYIDYQVNPEDFVETKEDLSEMTVSLENDVKVSDYGEYPVKVVVSDKYGNKTVGDAYLIITWLLGDVKVELGSQFSVANVVVDVQRFGSLVAQEELAKVDTNKIRNL